jgi:hypothetical protein
MKQISVELSAQLAEQFPQEELCSELQAFYTEDELFPCVKHPLVFSVPHTPVVNAMLNKALQQKKEMLIRAIKKKNWMSYVVLHERPHRLDALAKMMGLGFFEHIEENPADYWDMIRFIWTDSENIWQHLSSWKKLWTLNVPERYTLVDDLPDSKTFTIHRGAQEDLNEDGLSWTLDLERAQWFSNRFGHDEGGIVITRTVQRREIIAYINDRSEQEVVVMP